MKKVKSVKEIEIGDELTNVIIDGSIASTVIIHVDTKKFEELKQKNGKDIPIALTSSVNKNGKECKVYARSISANLAYDPNTGTIDCLDKSTHISIRLNRK